MDTTGIVVTGIGEVRVRPDAAVIRLLVSATEDTVAEATKASSSAAKAVGEALTASGVEDKDVQSSRVAVQPLYEHHDGARAFVGYQFTHELTARVRDLAMVGLVLDAALAAGGGAATLQSLDFVEATAEERGAGGGPTVEAARAAAYADARAKAKQLASLAGLRLGAVTAMSEDTFGSGFDVGVPVAHRASYLMDANAVPVSEGTLATTVTLTVRFSLH